MCSLCGFSELQGFTFSCQLLDNVAPTASSTLGCLWDPWSLLEREKESISFSGRTLCDCEADSAAVKSLEGSVRASWLCLSGPASLRTWMLGSTPGWEAGLGIARRRIRRVLDRITTKNLPERETEASRKHSPARHRLTAPPLFSLQTFPFPIGAPFQPSLNHLL